MTYQVYIMSANNNNEMNNNENIVMVVAEPVIVGEEFNMDALVPITTAELLDGDFDNDDEAEFIQGVLEIEQAIEDIILSDHPENFLLPTADDLPPAIKLLMKIDELKNYRFGNRTIARMERRIRGENLIVEEKLTQLEKSVHPDYKDWCCPKCLDYYKGARNLKNHMDTTQKCKDNHTRLFVKPTKNKVVKPRFYHISNVLNEIVERAEQSKKLIQKELEEEDYQEEEFHNVTITAEEQEVNDATANIYEEEPVSRCNPPCVRRYNFIGQSWWKRLGYPQPCGCAVNDFNEATEEQQQNLLN